MGAKRLSELMAERGFVLSDRAVQYYLRYLDETSDWPGPPVIPGRRG